MTERKKMKHRNEQIIDSSEYITMRNFNRRRKTQLISLMTCCFAGRLSFLLFYSKVVRILGSLTCEYPCIRH